MGGILPFVVFRYLCRLPWAIGLKVPALLQFVHHPAIVAAAGVHLPPPAATATAAPPTTGPATTSQLRAGTNSFAAGFHHWGRGNVGGQQRRARQDACGTQLALTEAVLRVPEADCQAWPPVIAWNRLSGHTLAVPEPVTVVDSCFIHARTKTSPSIR